MPTEAATKVLNDALAPRPPGRRGLLSTTLILGVFIGGVGGYLVGAATPTAPVTAPVGTVTPKIIQAQTLPSSLGSGVVPLGTPPSQYDNVRSWSLQGVPWADSTGGLHQGNVCYRPSRQMQHIQIAVVTFTAVDGVPGNDYVAWYRCLDAPPSGP